MDASCGSVEWATWDPTGISDFLNFMQASNANVVRCFLTVSFGSITLTITRATLNTSLIKQPNEVFTLT